MTKHHRITLSNGEEILVESDAMYVRDGAFVLQNRGHEVDAFSLFHAVRCTPVKESEED